MKTPRQILLDRHRHLDTRLEAVRCSVTAELERKATGPSKGKPERKPGPLPPFLDLIHSLRWHLSGLATVWCAIGLLNLNSGLGAAHDTARLDSPTSTQLVSIWQAYHFYQYDELNINLAPPQTPPPRPRKRSELPRTSVEA